ncbi:MAG: FAD-dependent oxidoreductase, partial [Thermohalobaculum sp.]|nr:FAD-dependent oxidoreductase [Thermohalobaculum sp.]
DWPAASVTWNGRAGGPGATACSWWAGGMLAPFCEGETAEPEVVRLGQAAADWWVAQGAQVTRRGTLVLAPARDRAELARFAARTTGHRAVTAEEIAALEPDLAGRARDGLFFAAEAHLDPRAALAALVARLAEAGVEIERGDTPPPGARVIDCRGWAARDSLPGLRGVRGEMAVLRCPDVALTRTLRLLHPRVPVYLVPRGGGIYMLGATMVESARPGPVTARALLELLSSAYALHPALAEAEVFETGADIRPAFADNLPRVVEEGGRIFVNGLYRHGFLMAPALARDVADRLAGPEREEASHAHHAQ